MAAELFSAVVRVHWFCLSAARLCVTYALGCDKPLFSTQFAVKYAVLQPAMNECNTLPPAPSRYTSALLGTPITAL
jgi:hypothetical protein